MFYAQTTVLDDPEQTEADAQEAILLMQTNPLPNIEARFLSRAAVSHVFQPSKKEGAFPANNHELTTLQLLEKVFHGEVTTPPLSKAQMQMSQHMKTLTHAWSLEGPLTILQVQKIHEIMMRGVETDVDAGVVPGEFRTRAAYTYPEPAAIPERTQAALDRFNRAQVTNLHQAIEHGTRFFVDVITVHPFADGNGRLCRVLLAVALKRGGVPFPIALSSGHRKARSHYAYALLLAQDAVTDSSIDNSKLGELRAMVLMSVNARIANYVRYAGLTL